MAPQVGCGSSENQHQDSLLAGFYPLNLINLCMFSLLFFDLRPLNT